MRKLSDSVFRLLVNSFVVSLIAILISMISAEQSVVYFVAGVFAIYGPLFTFYILLLHLLLTFIVAASKDK